MQLDAFYIVALLLCCRATASPALTSSGIKNVVEGNIYIQGTEQIFNICNGTIPNEPAPKPPKPPAKPNVPEGYEVHPGVGAHKLHATGKKWNEARSVCVEEGAHLLIVASPEEDQIVFKTLKEHKLIRSWQGVHEQFQNGDWITVLDQPLNKVGHTNWLLGEPNNSGSNEHCVAYEIRNEFNGYNDLNCGSELPFICKINL